jgi:hypothetical protein
MYRDALPDPKHYYMGCFSFSVKLKPRLLSRGEDALQHIAQNKL